MVLSFTLLTSLIFFTSCDSKQNFIANKRSGIDPTAIPALEKPTGSSVVDTLPSLESGFSLKDIQIQFENYSLNESTPRIKVSGIKSGATLKLKEKSCNEEAISTLSQDGVFAGFRPQEEYQEIQYWVELTYQGKTECQAIDQKWVHLKNPVLSLNETQTSLDKRFPKFNVEELFLDKEVEVSLYENDSCSGDPVSEIVRTLDGSVVVGISQSLSDLDTHRYWAKQSYAGVSSCSGVEEYSYNLDTQNLSLSYDEIIFGENPSGVSVSRILPGSSVSLHKGSCFTEEESSISEDGILFPRSQGSYIETPLFIKYSFDDRSVCSELESKYLYLEKAVISLNQAQTSLNKRRPSFDVSNLYSGKNVMVSLYENSSCTTDSVSDPTYSNSGSFLIQLNSDINDNNTHTYYVKQTYLEHSSCSLSVSYTYGLDIEDLTISSDPTLYGANPSSISVSGMIEGSSVSIHKGSCNAQADDSISLDGTLTPVAVNTYMDEDIYLKYSLNGASICQAIGVKYVNLQAPVLSLNNEQTALDKRNPKFNASNLFNGKLVDLSLHTDSSCLSAAVSSILNSDTGSAVIGLSSILTDTNSHSYYLKQSYLGVQSCSNVVNYKYDILVENLLVTGDEVLWGENPSVINVSKMLSGSSVSLHKGSCSEFEDDSISEDGSLSVTASNLYIEADLYLKYSKNLESDCVSIGKKYINLQSPVISLNEEQTALDKRVAQFNITNLFTGKNVSVSLYENSSCSGEAVSEEILSSTGSAIVGLSFALTDTQTHTYYVKQSYNGVSSCSLSGASYYYEFDVDNLVLSYDDILFGANPGCVSVSKMLSGSNVSLHKGSCGALMDDSINTDGSLTPAVVNSYTESDLFVKYSFNEISDCKAISSKYLNLEQGVLNLNAAQTSLHKRTPTFDVSNLFTGKNVTVALYENSTCTGVAVSSEEQTDTGSTSLTISSDINDNDTHNYYVKQSYLGHSTCSQGIQYTYGLDISDLTITSDPILYGVTPNSISVSGMIEGSSVSIHKGACNADTDDSISSDGTLTPVAVNTYMDEDIYLKYSLNGASTCQAIGVKYINLQAPVLSLNNEQTALDKRNPKFNATNLFTGKEVTISLHTDSSCLSASVSSPLNSDSGSAIIGLTSSLTDSSSHSYYLKQSYQGVVSCSNVVNYKYDILVENLGLSYDPLINGASPSNIAVSKMIAGSTISVHKGSCGAAADTSINADGNIAPSSVNVYTETDIYLKYTLLGDSDCVKLDTNYVRLLTPSLSLNVEQTALDKRNPKFNASNLFTGKNVTLTLHSDSGCSTAALSSEVQSNSGSALMELSSPLSDISSHSYYLKQSYAGLSSCSSVVNYSYELDVDNLVLSYDSILYGSNPGSVSVSKMLSGSSVSLHKGSCGASSDSSINADGSLTPAVVNTYIESDLFVKYSFNETSDCKVISSKYLNLEQATITLNSAQTSLHKRTPTFNVSNLFTGKNVTVALYENSTCTGVAVSSEGQTDTGSTSLTISSDINDNDTHNYYVKQSYLGYSTCSQGVQYTYGLDITDLTITSDPILYGVTPNSISVSGMIEGSSVSIHKGSCNADTDDSISLDGTLTPVAVNTYMDEDIYLKYSLNGTSTCQTIGVKYINLQAPVLSLNSEQTALDKRNPKFNATNLFTGKEVTISLHTDSSCLSASVSSPLNSDSGSAIIGLSSILTDISIHSYYLKQSYSGYSTCSNVLEYQYEIDVDNLGIVANELLYGATPGSVTISKMLSGSTVSLHKGSCGASADSSINADGSLTPTSTGSYNYSGLYIKYSKSESSDCSAIDSHYLYLEKATLAVNSAQTDLHPLTPTFDITNLFSGQNVSVQLYEDSSCSSDPVSETSSTALGSTTLTLSSAISDSDSHNYYVKQSFLGQSTCSLAQSYQFEADTSDLSLTYDPVLYGSTPTGVTVSGMVAGSSLSLYKGNNCNGVADSTINADGTIYPLAANSYTESDIYIKYSFDDSSSCRKLDTSYIYLETPTITLATPLSDARIPSFNVTNLFNGKSVTTTLHESSNCSGAAVSSEVVSSTGSSSVTKTSVLTDLNSHTFSVKQSYAGVTSCSNSANYQYSIDVDNLGIVANELLYGATPGSVTISKMISGSTVSLHKGSCGAAADASINAAGTLTPTSTGSYNYSGLYIKYSKSESSDCSAIDSHYLYLEKATLAVNSAQTALHPLTPTFNVTNLFSGQNVSVQLYEDSSCSSDPVSETSSTALGSTTLTLSSAISDSDSHNYYVKQSFLGQSTCSLAESYQFSADTSDLTLTYNPVLYGSTPTGVTVSGMVAGSSLSLYKGNNCNGVADSTINADGTIYPTAANSYTESDIYIKYSFDDSSSCTKLNTSYIYLETPTITLATPLSDARIPSYNVTNLFNGKSVITTLHESSNCSGAAVSSEVVSSTGSSSLTKTSALTDLNTHTFSVKQSYSGVTSCSNSANYQYSIDVDNLGISAAELLYGATPGSVTVSKMISGSTVSLHKGSCGAAADASINADGSLTSTSTGSYNYSQLYIKYTKSESSDCAAIDSHYLYLEQASLSLNSAQTNLHKRTPTFNVSNLFTGKNVTVTLYDNSTCSGVAVSGSEQTDSGSSTLTLSSSLSDTNTHTYYVKQSYLGVSTCSSGTAYKYDLDANDLVLVYDSLIDGRSPSSISVSGMLSGSSVSIHRGSCLSLADNTINSDGTITPSTTSSYTEVDLYLKYSLSEDSSCIQLESSYVVLEAALLALNSSLTNANKLIPQFDVSNLFTGKTVTVSLYENSTCSGVAVSSQVTTSLDSTTISVSSALTDTSSHSYYAKQTYEGLSSCSNVVNYQYSIDVDNLALSYDDILYGASPSGVSVSRMIAGSSVSLHKNSCSNPAQDTINSNGTLYPSASNTYTEDTLYIKYILNEDSDCKLISSKYLNLLVPTMQLNTAQTALHELTPSFDVSNLFNGKNVTLTLHESSGCSDSAISTPTQTSTGSGMVTRASNLEDTLTHTYYVKQSYLGQSTCSLGVNYRFAFGIDDDLTITGDPVLYGQTPSSISVSGMRSGSSVSLHKGSCQASADDSINLDGSLTPVASNTYIESDLYIKYTYYGFTDCEQSSSKYVNLLDPVLGLNAVKTAENERKPVFDVTNLFSGKTVTVTLYGNSTCTGDALSSSVESSTGEAQVELSSFITSYGSYSYYVKQSYLGISSCSNVATYQFQKHPVFDGFIHERFKSDNSYDKTYYNQNRGFFVKNTTYGNKLKVYTTSNCSGEENLVTTVKTWHYMTEVETPDLVDGLYTFGLQELDSSDNVLGCYPTPQVKLRLKRFKGGLIVSNDRMSVTDTDVADVSLQVTRTYTQRVKNLYANGADVALLFEDGSVATYTQSGNQRVEGLDGTLPAKAIYTTHKAFAVLRSDGSVVAWGDSLFGGTMSSASSSSLDGTIPVVKIFAVYNGSGGAFAALRSDGKVIVWGSSGYGGGNNSRCTLRGTCALENVETIYANDTGFVAIQTGGSIIAWGGTVPSYSVRNSISNVIYAAASAESFALLKSDGTVTSIGVNLSTSLSNIVHIVGNYGAFAALSSTGVAYVWGVRAYGGDFSTSTSTATTAAATSTSGISEIYSNYYSFAAIKTNGSVVTWGKSTHNYYGKSTNPYSVSGLDGSVPVNRIYPLSYSGTYGAYVAVLADGSAVAWGASQYGSSGTINTTPAVKSVHWNQGVIGFLRADKSVMFWGLAAQGTGGVIPTEYTDGTIPVDYFDTDGRIFYAELEDGTLVFFKKPSSMISMSTISNLTVSSAKTISGTLVDAQDNTKKLTSVYVHLSVDGVVVGSTTTNSSGAFSFNLVPTYKGPRVIELIFEGNREYNGYTYSKEVNVAGLSSSVSITNSRKTVLYGEPITIQASVSPSAATGTITFDVDGVTYDQTISTGIASQELYLTTGSHTITASYTGDTKYNSSSSSAVTFTAYDRKLDTSLTVNSLGTVYTNATPTVSGTLLDEFSNPVAEATVNISNGSTVYTATTSSSGTFSTTIASYPSVGTYSVTVSYAGDTLYNAATDASRSFSVIKRTPSISVSAPNVTYPSSSSITVTVSGASSGSGTVTVKKGSTTTITISYTLSSSSITKTTSLSAGTYSISASYAENDNYYAGTSSTVSHTVSKRTPTLTLTAPDELSYGQTLNVTASVPTQTTGTINIKVTDSFGTDKLNTSPSISNQSVSASVANLPVGKYTITATYNGDTNNNTKTVTTQLEVRKLEYVSSIPEYNKNQYYAVDQNRGIVIKGTKFGNSVKVYEGNSCNNELNLLATAKTTYDVSFVHLPNIEDGTHEFCFKELDSSSNELGTYTTGSVTYKTPEIYSNASQFIHIHDNTVDYFGTTNSSQTFLPTQAPRQVFSTANAFAVLHKDGSVTTYGASQGGGFASYPTDVSSSLTSGVVKIFSTYSAFAAVKTDGSVVTWGSSSYGGDSSLVSASLSSGVVSIFSNDTAFAALKNDGSVITWGDSDSGGDSSSVSASLSSGVVHIFSKPGAFAALKSDGSVVTWGVSDGGSITSPINVASKLTSGVISIFSTDGSFAALKEDGSVVTWGSSEFGADSSSVASSISSGVVNIFPSSYFGTFAALKSDGSVVTWGDSYLGGDSSSVSASLSSGVVHIFSKPGAFAALKSDGSVVTWGDSDGGGDSSSVSASLSSGIVSISSTFGAFAALKNDGSVVTWGVSDEGGNSSSVAASLTSGVVNIFPTFGLEAKAFSVLKSDGSVVSWGNTSNGGSQGVAASSLNGTIKVVDIIGATSSFMALREDGSVVIWGAKSYIPPVQISSTASSYAALKSDGSVVSWGHYGGNSSSVSTSISSGVKKIYSTFRAHAALKSDGSVITWGEVNYGGNSSSLYSSGALDGTIPVTKIFTASYEDTSGYGGAFAALRSDGSVITWGDSDHGGSTTTPINAASSLTSGVVDMVSNWYAFAALKSDGSVVTWGHGNEGGNSSSVSSSLSSGVVSLSSTASAFAALKSDGSVITWGLSANGGSQGDAASSLTSGVVKLFSTKRAFAALKSDGSVVAWGDSSYGGSVGSAASSLTSGVVNIYSTWFSFAALKSDGSVVVWGDSSQGGSLGGAASSLTSGVVDICATLSAFAALKSDGSVVTWGLYGGSTTSPVDASASLTSGVVKVFSSKRAFAALKSDGSVVTWGEADRGGSTTSPVDVSSSLTGGVVTIYSNWFSFAAVKMDGSVVTWGNTAEGANSSGVNFNVN